MHTDPTQHPDHPHHNGEGLHVPTLMSDLDHVLMLQRYRRRLLSWAAAAPVALLGGSGLAMAQTRARPPTPTRSSGSGAASCPTINDETAGPYPADGTNSVNGVGVNTLTLSGIVRSDMRSSFAGMTGVAPGVPLTVTLKLVNSSLNCASLAGRAIYLWHCDRAGNYSMYSGAASNQNYLRAVVVTDANGEARFTTIFPGCYSGRWPHMHFKIYNSLATAISGSFSVKTSQLALPAATCQQVYSGVAGYESSVANFARISLASDNVFRDDSAAWQLATVSGNATDGYAAVLQVGIASA